MKKQLIYLASPYSHEDKLVRELRFELAVRATGNLMRQGFFVFCPIAMTHPICIAESLPFEFDFHQELNHLMIDRCDAIVVLKLDGWMESKGIAAETTYARENHKDVYYLSPSDVPNFSQKAGKNLLWIKESK